MGPLVDVISWHPFYGHRPDDSYYQNYAQMVKELREVAAAQGFNGTYLAEEMLWRTESAGEPQQPVSAIVSAKYLSRAIVMHLGLDITASVSGMFPGKCRDFVRPLCTIMAGARPINLPIEIQSEAPNIKHYAFSRPEGDQLVALWTDGVAVDNDPGVPAVLVLQGISTKTILGVDIRNGSEQDITASTHNGNLRISNFLVRDYPIILRLIQ